MSSPRAFLSPKMQTLVRLVHAGGVMTMAELLTAYRTQTLAPVALRHTLYDLEQYGWLSRQQRPRPGRINGVCWMVTEEALPHLWSDDPLPMRPSPLPRRNGADGRITDVPRPAAPARKRAAPRPPLAAREAPINNASSFAPYVPPPAPPLRPGALDFLKYPSHGACR